MQNSSLKEAQPDDRATSDRCADSVLARSARATWHDRAKEIFVARVACAVEHARATAVSAAAALR